MDILTAHKFSIRMKNVRQNKTSANVVNAPKPAQNT